MGNSSGKLDRTRLANVADSILKNSDMTGIHPEQLPEVLFAKYKVDMDTLSPEERDEVASVPQKGRSSKLNKSKSDHRADVSRDKLVHEKANSFSNLPLINISSRNIADKDFSGCRGSSLREKLVDSKKSDKPESKSLNRKSSSIKVVPDIESSVSNTIFSVNGTQEDPSDLKCEVCDMEFPSKTKKHLHVEFSSLHANNVTKKAQLLQSCVECKVVRAKPGLKIYFEHKLFWRTKDNLDIHMFVHAGLNHGSITEVIAYDVNNERELNRLYFNTAHLITSIGNDAIDKILQETKRTTRESVELPSITDHEVLSLTGESMGRMKALGKLTASRLMVVGSDTAEVSRSLVYMSAPGESSKNIHCVDISTFPEGTMSPAIVIHPKKTRLADVASTMEISVY
eukprot:gene36245-47149_t